jgi:hypothetical protein
MIANHDAIFRHPDPALQRRAGDQAIAFASSWQ